MSLGKSVISWLKSTLGWSNSWTSWQERWILFGFLAVTGALAWFSVAFIQARGPQTREVVIVALLWATYFAGTVLLSWLGWLKLFGPVLFYDMVRTARRSRYVFLRLAYACLLLLVLLVIFLTAREWGIQDRNNRRETAILAEMFFLIFMLVQLAIVVLLTPAYVAGAIAEEKDRKTLEFMLATDLSNREIVLSKLLSRLSNMALLLMTGLPILSILQFVGGVDAQLMLTGFAGTGLTMLSIASVGILFSTLFQKPRDAIGLTYLFIVAYLALATLGKSLTVGGAILMTWSYVDGGLTLGDVSNVLNAGNPIAAIIDIVMSMRTGTLATVLSELLVHYTYAHLGATLVATVWSIVRLRAIALRQTVAGRTQKTSWWERYRPPIGDLPMFWKELHIEGRMKLNWLAWGIVIILVVITIGTGLFVILAFGWDLMVGHRGFGWWQFSEQMNIWFRIAGTGVACLLILIVAVRASTSVATERERDTFDALITTPMSAEAILGAKLIGCLVSLRMGWLWYGIMITLAMLAGGVHLLAVPIVLGAWFVYATFFTMVGMWFSMACKTSMRATVYTVLTTLFLGGGHWVFMGFFCYFPAAMLSHGGPGDFLEHLAKFQAGMTPPIVLGLFSYSWQELGHDFRAWDDWKHVMLYSVFGLVLWGAGCLVMWYGLLLPKFKQITRREELIYE